MAVRHAIPSETGPGMLEMAAKMRRARVEMGCLPIRIEGVVALYAGHTQRASSYRGTRRTRLGLSIRGVVSSYG